jgi:hypothetical protein
LLVAIGLATVVAVIVIPEYAQTLKQRRSTHVRIVAKSLSPDVLRVVEPIEVKEIAVFEDGGTIGLEARDANGEKFFACLEVTEVFGPLEHLYLGAIHPKHQGARRVEYGSPEEAALCGLLVRWSERVRAEQESNERPTVDPWQLKGVEAMARVLEKRFVDPRNP